MPSKKKTTPRKVGRLDQPLKAERVQIELRTVPGWKKKQRAAEIYRTYELPTFPAAVRFVDWVAELAEAANHHPDIDIRYNKVRLELSTHSAGGLTGKDFALARQIDHH